ADPGSERDGAAVDVVHAVAVDEIRKARRTTDPGKGDDLFVIELAFLEHFVEGSEHGEIAAAGTPCRVIGGDGFFGELFAVRGRTGGWWSCCCCFAHRLEIFTTKMRKMRVTRRRVFRVVQESGDQVCARFRSTRR